jgi:acetolactate synthase I/II/III large subunit
MKLSDYVLKFVADSGVKHAFLVVGGGAMHLNEALSRSSIVPICNLHEQASAIGAENYSKATNHLGFALLTTGPGGTNAITGLAGAWLDSTPTIFVSGQVKRADRMFHADGTPMGVRQVGVQEVDIISVVNPLTKYAVTVLEPEDIRYHMEKAFYLAVHGRPGPVWIDIPLDVQAAPIDETKLRGFDPAELGPVVDADLAGTVAAAIEALNRSERPMLLIGNGIRLSRAEAEMEQLLRALDIPAEVTWLAIDLMADDDPLYVGRPGTIAQRGANFAIQNCDYLLSIGARQDRVVTGFSPAGFAREAYKVMVDIDQAELAKMHDAEGKQVIHTPVCCDAGDFIREMLAQSHKIERRPRADWKQRCAEWRTRYPLVLPEHKAAGRVSVYNLAEVMSGVLKEGDFIVSGSSGTGIELFLLAFRVKKNQRIFHTTALGSMGFGIPAAIGACLGGDSRSTIVVDGDGGFQFNIQELETVRRLNLPIKFFVLNNEGYGSIRASQKVFFGETLIGCDDATGQSLPDVRRVAEAYGIKTATIASQGETDDYLIAEIKRVLDMPGPVVCDVHIVLDEIRQPRLSSTQRPDGSFVSKPLEDLWPFLSREEFAENMIIAPLPE